MATIALVDDDRNILTSVGMLLEQEGYHVRAYADGASALTALQATPPDLAILDIKMPSMDGLELLRRLRQNGDLPVIFLTSKDEEIDELMGLNAGADDYIRKPFSQRLLLERVRAVLRRADARRLVPGSRAASMLSSHNRRSVAVTATFSNTCSRSRRGRIRPPKGYATNVGLSH